jgi:hypothetical protein
MARTTSVRQPRNHSFECDETVWVPRRVPWPASISPGTYLRLRLSYYIDIMPVQLLAGVIEFIVVLAMVGVSIGLDHAIHTAVYGAWHYQQSLQWALRSH